MNRESDVKRSGTKPSNTKPSGTRHAAQVAVIGGGLGGVAAALAALELGSRVVLTEEYAVLGGQLTSQLVTAPDEHPQIESGGATRAYLNLRRAIRAEYGGIANPGGGWVSRVCCEPAVALKVIDDLLRPFVESEMLTILTGVRPVEATRRWVGGPGEASPASVVTSVRLIDDDGAVTWVDAARFVDATELGDLLALTGTSWTIGSEGSLAFGEDHAVPGGPDCGAEQSATWCAALEWAEEPQSVPAPPEDYEMWRDSQNFSLDLAGWDGRVHSYRMLSEGPNGELPFWTYRRLRDAELLGGRDVIVLNWNGNDYSGVGMVAAPELASRNAKALTRAFIHWLRTEVPRDDGGFGYPEIVPSPRTTGTEDGLALAPYIRESRRLRIDNPLRLQDIVAQEGHVYPPTQPTSLAVGWYHADLHPRVGHPGSVYSQTAPFQIPARTLVNRQCVNLIMGAKNLAATQMAAAAARVHPAEWGIGEAAGVIAALSQREGWLPSVLSDPGPRVREVQEVLLSRGAPIAWTPGVPDDAPDFASAQRRAGGLEPEASVPAGEKLLEPQDVLRKDPR